MERREIVALPLAPIYKTRLLTAGYRTIQDLTGVYAEQLSKDVGLSATDCENLLADIERCKSCIPKPGTALQRLKSDQSLPPIMTFSERLDTALGGGIQAGIMTELAGVPGVGKTQLCLQLACDVQIPAIFGGLEGEAIYIDTEGGVIIDRVKDIVMATIKHCQFVAQGETDKDIQAAVKAMSLEKLLAGIHVYSCYDNAQLLAVINLLPDMLRQNSKIKLVIIDSVAFHFRHDFDDLSLRTRILTNLAQTLIQIAREFNIAVVLTNQMTTRVYQGSEKGSHLVPCLGESWGHACTTRLLLQWERDLRVAWLHKSPSQPQARVPFQITGDGIRDVVTTVQQQESTLSESPPEQPHKRQKLL